MQHKTIGELFLYELESEVSASRKCLERVPESLYEWKPHEKSMKMGDLAILVAEIPKWITETITKSEINFVTYTSFKPKTTAELVQHFDICVEGARKALEGVSDAALQEFFYLKNGGIELMKQPKDESIQSSLNHWVHHRGQLTVYMRLNNIAVPSIYGPSADEKIWG